MFDLLKEEGLCLGAEQRQRRQRYPNREMGPDTIVTIAISALKCEQIIQSDFSGEKNLPVLLGWSSVDVDGRSFPDRFIFKECEATVVSVNNLRWHHLNRTNFYPTGGGQPGDTGILRLEDGRSTIATTVKGKGDENGDRVPAERQEAPATGTKVVAVIDWERRYKHMQMHTALHLMCNVVPAG